MSTAISLQDRNVLIVGASAGIGRAAAQAVAALGANVGAVGRRPDRLEALVEELGRGVALAADIRDPLQCGEVVERAAAALGRVDALIFAASASSLALTKDADAETWRAVLETNVMAPALVTRSLLPHLAPRAFLAYLSSEVVGQPYHGLVHYAASKAALEELVRGLREEHPAHGFCCMRVGATIDTEFARDFSGQLSAQLLPEWMARAKLPASFMVSHDVGTAIAQAVAVALSLPGLDVQDFTLRPAGGPLVGSLQDLADTVGDANPTTAGGQGGRSR